jgi:plastocyanin
MHLNMNPRATFGVLLVAAMLLVQPALANAGRAPATAEETIAIMNFAFQPATLTVDAGSRVVWVNHDEEPHAVVSVGAQFKNSPAMDTDDRYAVVFATPGTYTYFCSIHPHMVGKIIVR